MNVPRILFTGYASVHFVCFWPVYQQLLTQPVQLFLSGGFKTPKAGKVQYSLEGFYDHFAVQPEHIIPFSQAHQQHFDVLVCAHLSDSLFPQSVGKTVQIFHGVSFKNLAVRDKALRYDILCLPGRYHAQQYRANGLLRQDGPRYFVTGFPKTDPLVNPGLNRTDLLQSLGLDPQRPTLLLAPTGEKHNALDSKGVEIIQALRAVEDWNLLIKPHDHPKKKIDWFQELASLENERVRLVRAPDIIPYLHAADLLITDASSVAVEYTLLDRPIVFIDVPALFKRLRKRAPALDLTTYGRKIGVVVEEIADLTKIVADSLTHPQRESKLRQAMATHIFHAAGQASRNVAAVVLQAAGLGDWPAEDGDWPVEIAACT